MPKKNSTNSTNTSSSKPNTNDSKWTKCIAQNGQMVATAIVATDLIKSAQQQHKLSAIEMKPLAEALMAGLLLVSTCKKEERLSLSIKGNGFLKQAMIDAQPSGAVRGFLITRSSTDNIDVTQGPWQSGTISVARLKEGKSEPYIGTVPLVTGHLAKDITFYLSQSEQIPSAVGLAVNQSENGELNSAGAFLVQILPGASDDEVAQLEKNINKMESLAKQIANHSNPTKILGEIFHDMSFVILEEKPLSFECNCSKARINRALKLLGADEINDMIQKDHGAEVHCDFCSKNYKFSEEDLKALL